MSEASRLAATQPLPDRVNALGAVQAYCHLLTALRRHGWQLLGGDDRELGVSAVRPDTPIDELSDCLACLHRRAWQLAGDHPVGIATLADYAALGVILFWASGICV
jgi:hypothetical protein